MATARSPSSMPERGALAQGTNEGVQRLSHGGHRGRADPLGASRHLVGVGSGLATHGGLRGGL